MANLTTQGVFHWMPRLHEKFWKFDEDNPEVYRLFARYAFEMKRSGRKRYSARTIMERIRWHVALQTTEDDGFKISNNHIPYYARLLVARHPEFDGFFSFNESTRIHIPQSKLLVTQRKSF